MSTRVLSKRHQAILQLQEAVVLVSRQLTIHCSLSRSEVEGDLRALAQQQPGLLVERLPTSDPLTSALHVSVGGSRLLAVVTKHHLRLESCDHPPAQLRQAQRWASDAHAGVSRQKLLQAVREACGAAAL